MSMLPQYGIYNTLNMLALTVLKNLCREQPLSRMVWKCSCNLSLIQKRWAGHSKWQNIKFKKMHKDNARSKIFGQLSREIIQAVKENGADPHYNPKLEALISKAKSASMPKEKIETSIKNALRNSDEKHVSLLLQARGPGKCGLMIDVLTPNPLRSKPELKNILRKNDATFIEDGSVAFMFNHKGVIAIEDTISSSKHGFVESAIEKSEEIAIMIGAEDVLSVHEEDNKKHFKFLCQPFEVSHLQKQIKENYPELSVVSADVQYLAKSLVSLTEEQVEKSDRLIEAITDHPDVINVYDNIIEYPSKTIKCQNDFSLD